MRGTGDFKRALIIQHRKSENNAFVAPLKNQALKFGRKKRASEEAR
jgi:hypothetical protein